MKTVLSINIYQSVFITLALFTVGIVCICKVGGLWDFLHLPTTSKSGNPMPSTLLPVDLDLRSQQWYALPSGLIWVALAGTAWIACNFGMAQRLLAAKSEVHAQKAMLYTGAGATITFFIAYTIGVSINRLEPGLDPDRSYIHAIVNLFPIGVRGLMIAGLIASLISTIDGLLTASGTLVTQDIFLRFVKPGANDENIKLSTRATPWAAFAGALAGTSVMFFFYFVFPEINFLNRGIFGFTTVIVVTLVGSLFEKAPSKESLLNLTVFTLEGTRGPWVGLLAWPNLW